MKVVYIAGPFRGANYWEQEQNIRRAEQLALDVWKLGFAAICPHTNTRFFQGAAPDDVWLAGDIAIMLLCDAVLMTPDWNGSYGASKERAIALDNLIPVFYDTVDLVLWEIWRRDYDLH